MTTTSSTLAAGKAIAGQGGNGKGGGRRGLRATLAAGVAILGCAAALTFGGLRAHDGAQTQPATSAATQQAPAGFILSPNGRTGPADEYLQGDLASALQSTQRTGPADEYNQAEGVITPQVTHGNGAADESDFDDISAGAMADDLA